MTRTVFSVENKTFLKKALQWAQQFKSACLFHSNGYTDPYSNVECMLAVDPENEFFFDGEQTFEKIEQFKTDYPHQWVVGFFAYDLKNEIEDLNTSFPNPLQFPEAYFFVPRTVLLISHDNVEIHSTRDIQAIFESIQQVELHREQFQFEGQFQKKMSKQDYLRAFGDLKRHIQRGDIYEVNLCQEFYVEYAEDLSPVAAYWELNNTSPTPFSTFFKQDDKYILSASPERFLAKRGETLISQPIKGTAPRGKHQEEDELIKKQLLSNPKEIAENVMIVDLVRNDMTRSAKPGTVAAERKLEIHSFKQVHQLISTITCQINPGISDLEAIRQVFPAGSMTGAPKISAMRLCDRYEKSKRGIYSGAVGYFAPNGDFDFNVIIRTLLYNQTDKYLSFHTGGAITIDADAEQEYQECMVKARGILTALNTSLQE